jgi:hypothetical protein
LPAAAEAGDVTQPQTLRSAGVDVNGAKKGNGTKRKREYGAPIPLLTLARNNGWPHTS